jgi:hypothetical protein
MSILNDCGFIYSAWWIMSDRIQTIISKIYGACENPNEIFLDYIGDLLISTVPSDHRNSLGDSVDDFVESFLYPHRKGATIAGFRKILGWLQDNTDKMKFSETKEAFEITERLASKLVRDYSARLASEKAIDNLTPETICATVTEYFLSEKPSLLEWTELRFLARFQCFSFFHSTYLGKRSRPFCKAFTTAQDHFVV